MFPFDGKWTVQLYDASFKNVLETPCIHIVSNQFKLKNMNLTITVHGDKVTEVPFIEWPEPENLGGSVYRFELIDSFDFSSSRFGPEIGQVFLWETHHPGYSQMIWVRLYCFHIIMDIQTSAHLRSQFW
jgi:hypothetical protein